MLAGSPRKGSPPPTTATVCKPAQDRAEDQPTHPSWEGELRPCPGTQLVSVCHGGDTSWCSCWHQDWCWVSPWCPLVLPFLDCVPLGLLLRQGSHQSLPKTDKAEVPALTAPCWQLWCVLQRGQSDPCVFKAVILSPPPEPFSGKSPQSCDPSVQPPAPGMGLQALQVSRGAGWGGWRDPDPGRAATPGLLPLPSV